MYESILCAWFALTITSTANDDTTKKASLTSAQIDLNRKSFEVVWQTIRDKHFDPKLGGLDWQKIHDEFQPKIDKAQTMAQFRELVEEMISRLGQSHFGLVPRDAYSAVKAEVSEKQKGDKVSSDPKAVAEPAPSGRDTPGFTARVVGRKALVIKVDPTSPAAKAGVRPGWEILNIQGQDIPALLDKLAKSLKTSKNPELEMNLAVLNRLRGKAGDSKDMVFRDGSDKEVSLSIALVKPSGVPVQFGQMPTIYVTHTVRKVDKTIAFFQLSAFFDLVNVMKALETTVRDNMKSDGFILDLRGNPGGIGAMAIGFGGFFIEKSDQKLGTMITRDGSLHFVLNPRSETYAGPLAILVDGMSASTSEILAGGLKDLKRARVFGSRTMGAALPSQVIRLPNGDGFQYAFANYVSVGGKALEGNGVVPDVEVPLTRAALLADQDPVLDAAVRWIRTQHKAKQRLP